jgi:thiaminase/transcriptional activator TenA
MKSLSRELWRAHRPLADACRESRFVQRLADGTLPRDAFRSYVAQDACFLEAFARAYAMALAHCPDSDGVAAFARLLAGVMDELRLHADYARTLRIDLRRVKPARATTAYTRFLLETARRRNVGTICAAMTPCMRLYAFLGQSLARGPIAAHHPYADWIRTYSSRAFEELARSLERLLDRYARRSAPVRAAYRRAMALELRFFEAFSP